MAYIKKFQEGGAAPTAAPAGAPTGGEQDPIQMLAEMAMQALQSQDPQLALGVCQGLVEMAQGAGGSAPAPAAPVMMRKGGKLVKMPKKKC